MHPAACDSYILCTIGARNNSRRSATRRSSTQTLPRVASCIWMVGHYGFVSMLDLGNSCTNDVVTFGPFRLFVAERLLKKDDESLPIGGRALDLLIALVERPGEVLTNKELRAQVWSRVTVEEAKLRA